jgi:hypothetical protein
MDVAVFFYAADENARRCLFECVKADVLGEHVEYNEHVMNARARRWQWTEKIDR